MICHTDITQAELISKIKTKEICWGGNRKLNIYGLLNCSSGKRMQQINRVFFTSEKEAIQNRYRPCGHCMKTEYKKWKDGLI
jgi:methylphosphotriester-DNA--protein-cysteine methyltransferase